MAPRYSARSALATRSTLERPCEGLAWLAIAPTIKGAGKRPPALPDRHPLGKPVWLQPPDLGVLG